MGNGALISAATPSSVGAIRPRNLASFDERFNFSSPPRTLPGAPTGWGLPLRSTVEQFIKARGRLNILFSTPFFFPLSLIQTYAFVLSATVPSNLFSDSLHFRGDQILFSFTFLLSFLFFPLPGIPNELFPRETIRVPSFSETLLN